MTTDRPHASPNGISGLFYPSKPPKNNPEPYESCENRSFYLARIIPTGLQLGNISKFYLGNEASTGV